MFYLFSMNGAAIKMHNSQEDCLRQARLWKSHHLDKKVSVEEHIYISEKGYVRTFNDISVETPMLVPELTPRYDWDSPPYGA